MNTRYKLRSTDALMSWLNTNLGPFLTHCLLIILLIGSVYLFTRMVVRVFI